jgi:RNA polymerase sigma-54 factor
VASKSVKEDIRKLIADEDPRKPLSDNEIVSLLAESGIKIARRTVAKYREMMNILPSSRRRKFF